MSSTSDIAPIDDMDEGVQQPLNVILEDDSQAGQERNAADRPQRRQPLRQRELGRSRAAGPAQAQPSNIIAAQASASRTFRLPAAALESSSPSGWDDVAGLVSVAAAMDDLRNGCAMAWCSFQK